ncbi:MAG TPA: hypothetical protein VF297_06680 [Pyrinomonadaceae bacterium]
MTNWMRRRIERSRARCDRAATSHKANKEQEAESQSKLAAAAPHANEPKGR